MDKAKKQDEGIIKVCGLDEVILDALGNPIVLNPQKPKATLRDALILIWQSSTKEMAPKEKARRGAMAVEASCHKSGSISYSQSDCKSAKEIIGRLEATMIVKRVWDALDGKKDWHVFTQREIKPTPAKEL